jgi:hypothetical protein
MRKKLRQVSLLVVFTLVLSYFSLTTGYEQQEQSEAVLVTDIDFGDLLIDEGKENTVAPGGTVSYTCSSAQEAGEELREALKDRKGTVTIKLDDELAAKTKDYADFFYQFYDIAIAHTGNGNEGDYLHWNMRTMAPTVDYTNHVYNITIRYLSDASMEKETTQAIQKMEKKLSIKDSDSTFEKIQIIYDYLAKHITYETKDESLLPYSTYDAAVKGKAVCQGYATLFYRILLDYGIDNRIIVSNTHAWNLVGLDGKYYECDVTWDSQGVQEGRPYEYLLTASRGVERDEDHTWQTSEMDGGAEKLPRATSDYTEQSSAVPSLKVAKKNRSAVLKWSAVKNVQGYRVYRKTGNGSWKMIAVTAKTTYTDKDLKKDTYSYRVQPYYMILKGSYSKTKKIVRQ